MTTPKEIAVQWFERVWQQRSKDAIYQLLPEDGVAHQEGGRTIKGPKQFSGFHDALLTAFPDLSLEILHAIGDDTHAAIHWQVTGTHTGPFAHLSATGAPVKFTGMSFITVKNGQITEGWDCWDQGTLFQSLSAEAAG